MPRKALFAAALLTLLLAVFTLAGTSARTAAADPALDSEEQAFVTLINNYRAQNGAGPLTVVTTISNASDWMSADMGQEAYFDHTDSLGRNPWDRMCDFGYCYATSKGENIAAGYTTAQSVFNAWKASSGHDKNMRNASFKAMGIARVYTPGSPYGWYWTNDFAGLVPPGQPGGPTNTPAPTVAPTPSPAPTPTPAPGCPNDTDCDGWTNVLEQSIGTNPNAACSATTAKNDEYPDAWPPDVNDDQVVDIMDAVTFRGAFNLSESRFDLNADGRVTLLDITMLGQAFGQDCSG